MFSRIIAAMAYATLLVGYLTFLGCAVSPFGEPDIVIRPFGIPIHIRGHITKDSLEIAAYIKAVHATIDEVPNGDIQTGPVLVYPERALWLYRRPNDKELSRVLGANRRGAVWVEWSSSHGAPAYAETRMLQSHWTLGSVDRARDTVINLAKAKGVTAMRKARKRSYH